MQSNRLIRPLSEYTAERFTESGAGERDITVGSMRIKQNEQIGPD